MRVAARAAAAALAFLVEGCLFLPTGGDPNSALAGAPSPMGRGLRDYRAGFHVHCHLSHDSDGRIEDIAAVARALGLDAIILNDHYEPGNISRAPRGLEHGVLFLPGVEMRAGARPGAKSGVKQGSILAFPLESDFQKKGRSPADLLQEMERQGAVSAAGHVEGTTDWTSLGPIHAFEVYNLHAEFAAASWGGVAFGAVFLPADAFFERAVKTPTANLALWDRLLAEGRRLTPLAGHDAHANVNILGVTIGTYAEILRLFSNHILATELTVDAVAEAVRSGRVYIVFDFLGDGTGFSFTYGEHGAPVDRRAILGDSPPYRPEDTLEVSIPGGPADPPRVRFLGDGRMLAEVESRRASLTPPGPGVYRVEVYREDRLWILSAPIYVERPEEPEKT